MNASYVYGLQIVTAHMKRALGAVTTWDTFQKMTQHASPAEMADVLEKATIHHNEENNVHMTEHIHRAATALPHSHEDHSGHKAVHGDAQRKEHHGPGEAKGVAGHH